ncbi:SDR family NAD(P)-dependent oxidoreductase [Sphingobium nicotianae]|uniref:SDR family NAD(P)-dependent oxidoreductase n=1 Tax=Sphingobium nicotianae TaxID=2782607 RepID=A0A9X1DDY8_9SPHN|nr:SDR family NAD(P)-dependent oxidoreductase [Sphingobium nicotianae]MBT2188124.1 SDR family NAD(P)-dependent oxidoreductase [Sphingobium nicotianae]
MSKAGLLNGKVAIVTGGGRGIGRSHALTLARHGAAVLVNDLGSGITGSGTDPAPAEAVVAEIQDAGGVAHADTTDIADWNSAGALVDAALTRFGRLDILVNNAGITQYGSIETESAQGWARTLAVNLTGTAALMHWAARHWAAQGPAHGRAVINTSSPAGTNPPPGATSYCVSKAGVAALTVATATELAHLGVRVNALAPMARSRMTDAVPILDDIMRAPEQGFDRMAPDNISRLMLYLASPECRFTGRIFGVDGDDIYLFEGMSAETHLSNGGAAWDQDALARALDSVDQQDRAYMIAPSLHTRAGSPPREALDALDRIARGEAPGIIWRPIDT